MPVPTTPIRSLLIANRSEIAIRVMRAASEMHIRTIAVYSQQDRQALHRFKADESYLVGEGQKPLAAYLDGADILRIARQAGADAIHPGYGFLSENPEFAEAVIAAGIRWVGPSPEVMRTLGNKVAARHAAVAAGVAVMPASPPLPLDDAACAAAAQAIGYPVMLKASWGGGGRGMRVIEGPAELPGALAAARREALAAFGNDEVYLEKLIRRARHVEVQILGDLHGQVVHLHERDCTAQRRNQKVVERAPAHYLTPERRVRTMRQPPLRLDAGSVGYTHAGTVEFLMDADYQQLLFHRGQPAHPSRTHGDRRGHRRRHRQGADPGVGGWPSSACWKTRPMAAMPAACRRRTQVKLERLRAAVPRHHRRPGKRLHCRTTAGMARVPQSRPVSACGWTAARRMAAR